MENMRKDQKVIEVAHEEKIKELQATLASKEECYTCGKTDEAPKYCIECYSKLEKDSLELARIQGISVEDIKKWLVDEQDRLRADNYWLRVKDMTLDFIATAIKKKIEGETQKIGGVMETFRQELETLINRYSLENGSNTPDFILADYLMECLQNFDKTMGARSKWYGHEDKPGTH